MLFRSFHAAHNSAQTPQGIEQGDYHLLESLVFDMEDERLEESRWHPDFWVGQLCGQNTEGGASLEGDKCGVWLWQCHCQTTMPLSSYNAIIKLPPGTRDTSRRLAW